MSEETALHLGQYDSIADQDVDPELTIVEGQVQDEPSRVGELLLELVVDEVQNVFFINTISFLQLTQDVLLYG